MRYDQEESSGLAFPLTAIVLVMSAMIFGLLLMGPAHEQPAARVFVPQSSS